MGGRDFRSASRANISRTRDTCRGNEVACNFVMAVGKSINPRFAASSSTRKGVNPDLYRFVMAHLYFPGSLAHGVGVMPCLHPQQHVHGHPKGFFDA